MIKISRYLSFASSTEFMGNQVTPGFIILSQSVFSLFKVPYLVKFSSSYDQFCNQRTGFRAGLLQGNLPHFFGLFFAQVLITDIIRSFFSQFGYDSLDCCVSTSIASYARCIMVVERPG